MLFVASLGTTKPSMASYYSERSQLRGPSTRSSGCQSKRLVNGESEFSSSPPVSDAKCQRKGPSTDITALSGTLALAVLTLRVAAFQVAP